MSREVKTLLAYACIETWTNTTSSLDTKSILDFLQLCGKLKVWRKCRMQYADRVIQSYFKFPFIRPTNERDGLINKVSSARKYCRSHGTLLSIYGVILFVFDIDTCITVQMLYVVFDNWFNTQQREVW